MLNLVDVPRKPVFQYQEYQQIFHIFFWDIQFLLEEKTDFVGWLHAIWNSYLRYKRYADASVRLDQVQQYLGSEVLQ